MEFYGLIYLIMFGTTIWIACDSRALGVTTDGKPYHFWNGAAAWVFCCVMLWLVTFPYYLSRRSVTLRRPADFEETLTSADRQRTPLVLCVMLGLVFLAVVMSGWALTR